MRKNFAKHFVLYVYRTYETNAKIKVMYPKLPLGAGFTLTGALLRNIVVLIPHGYTAKKNVTRKSIISQL